MVKLAELLDFLAKNVSIVDRHKLVKYVIKQNRKIMKCAIKYGCFQNKEGKTE